MFYSGYIDNQDLAALYNTALTFLYPSLRESVGIPILEAMACGTPFITSHSSSMPEVAGEGAVLINPEQPQQIADALIKLENDADFYQKQVDYGLERVKLFSWRNTAEAYSKIYREIQKKQSLET